MEKFEIIAWATIGLLVYIMFGRAIIQWIIDMFKEEKKSRK